MAEIQVGRYLFERIKQLGIKTVFGVPGGKGNQFLYFGFISTRAGINWRYVRIDLIYTDI
jgi:TPP-dependent 2-oxoacid decarboxylase